MSLVFNDEETGYLNLLLNSASTGICCKRSISLPSRCSSSWTCCLYCMSGFKLILVRYRVSLLSFNTHPIVCKSGEWRDTNKAQRWRKSRVLLTLLFKCEREWMSRHTWRRNVWLWDLEKFVSGLCPQR